MSGVSVAERARLSWLLMRRALRSAVGRLNAMPILRWRYVSPKTDRLLIAPEDLRTADPTRASEIYSGRFAFAGKIVICDRRSPFEMSPPSDEWAAQLLGFGWLRHLRAADTGIARANARALVDEWISLQGSWHETAWRPDILARRIISWLAQSPLVLHDADVQFYRRFLRNLSRQVRYLRGAAGDARDGAVQIKIGIALCFASLCMAGQGRHLNAATRKLTNELERQILPDGGHISRNPGVPADLLIDLLPLRQAFTSRNIAPPALLLNAIERMMPMLRFFRHADGSFALFNGMGPTVTADVATVQSYDDTHGTPVANAAHSGYQKLRLNDLLAIVDTGVPPPLGLSQEAHASCLAFELSSGAQRIVVNCGMTAINRESWRQLARATAAHSTATFNDASSCRFREIRAFRKLIGVPIVSGPRHVTAEREDRNDAVILRGSHDGYADRYGIIHRRTLTLLENGRRLEGEDTFSSPRGTLPAGTADDFAIRFHLHPSIKANRLADGHSVMLLLPSRDVWSFDAHEDHVELEESVFLAGNDGPRRTLQIVISGRASQVPRVHWTLSHTNRTTAPQTSPRRNRGDEPELPLE